MSIYFDNAASTRPISEAVECMKEVMCQQYANPASVSAFGMKAEQIIIDSRKQLAAMIYGEADEIYFTSGGTESNNWAIKGITEGYARSGRHIITTSIEHPSVSEPIKHLEEMGWEVTRLSVDKDGYIYLDQLEEAIRKDTVLVSILHVNNEVGTIQPIEKIGKLIKMKNPSTVFHVDAVQGFGKMDISVKKSQIDLLTVSGHKFHSPKGLGFLYIKKGIRIKPLLLGGGQQQGLRSGTENAAGAAALCCAAKTIVSKMDYYSTHVLNIKRTLAEGVLTEIANTKLIGPPLSLASPYILNISFEGIRSEVLLHALEEEQIYVSAGSACSSRKKSGSQVLRAIGCTDKEIEGAIRFSFCPFNTVLEAGHCVKILKKVIPMLRKYNRR